jgi:hypothetical protein
LLLNIREPLNAVHIFLLADCNQTLALLRLIRPSWAGIIVNIDLHLLRGGGYGTSLTNQEVGAGDLNQGSRRLFVLSRLSLRVLFWVLATFLMDSVSSLHDSLELLLLLQEGLKLIQIQLSLLLGLWGGLKALNDDIDVSAMGVAD